MITPRYLDFDMNIMAGILKPFKARECQESESSQRVPGTEKTKKQAIARAAALAMAFLKAQPLYAALQPSNSLLQVIGSLLTDEVSMGLSREHSESWAIDQLFNQAYVNSTHLVAKPTPE